MIDRKLYTVKKFSQWDELYPELEKLFASGQQWIFRGQRSNENDHWDFQSSLERAVINFTPYDNSERNTPAQKQELDRKVLKRGVLGPSGKYQNVIQFEGGLLREFKRKSQMYLSHLPKKDNTIEWFALMRHYGAPTRLLDWTYSAFVAVHFALEEESEKGCTVWAFNSDALLKPVAKIVQKLAGRDQAQKDLYDDKYIAKPKTFNNLFVRQKPVTMIGAVNPYNLNERLIVQQGVFLCPGDVRQPFEDNMSEILIKSPDSAANLIKFEIAPSIKEKRVFWQRLRRMNISSTTLYPGLEGFAKSLTKAAAFPNILSPDEDWLKVNR